MSHLLVALGTAAVQAGHRARYFTAPMPRPVATGRNLANFDDIVRAKLPCPYER
jgi:hypothetical protein